MNISLTKTIPAALLFANLQACADNQPATQSALHAGAAGAAGAVADAPPDPPPPVAPPAAAGAAAVGRKAYIGLFGDSAIGVLDVDNKRVIKTIPVTAPDGLIITPDGKKVFVSSTDTGSVKVLDTNTDTLATSIDVGAKPAGLSITPDGRLVVAAVGGADEAVLIDVDSNAVVRHVSVPAAHASCITSDGHYAYVGSQVTTAPAVVKVDLEQDTPPQVFPVDKSPRMLDCQADRIYFTAIGLDAVDVFDPATGKLDTPIATGGSPHDIRAEEPGQTELVVSQTAGDLEFIDVASAAVVANVPTGKLAHWITLSTDRASAYITNEGDDNVSVVDLKTRAVTDTIPVGKAPRKMALQP